MTPVIFSKLQKRITESKNFAFGFWLSIFIDLFLVDLLFKYLAHKQSWPIFLNDQLAFSVPAPPVVIFSLYAIIIFLIARYLSKHFWRGDVLQQFAWVLVVSGGVANIIERIISGHVTDYIFILSGVFNLADFYILIGLLILLVLRRN